MVKHVNLGVGTGNISWSLEAEPSECWSCWKNKEVDTTREREKAIQVSTSIWQAFRKSKWIPICNNTWTPAVGCGTYLFTCRLMVASLPTRELVVCDALLALSWRASWPTLWGTLMYIESLDVTLEVILLFWQIKRYLGFAEQLEIWGCDRDPCDTGAAGSYSSRNQWGSPEFCEGSNWVLHEGMEWQ